MTSIESPAMLAQEPVQRPSPSYGVWEALQARKWYVQSVAMEGLSGPLTFEEAVTVQVSDWKTMTVRVPGCRESLFLMAAMPNVDTFGITEDPYNADETCHFRVLRELMAIALGNTSAIVMDGDDLLLRGTVPFVEVHLSWTSP